MKKTISKIAFNQGYLNFILLILALTSCDNTKSKESIYMAFDNITHVDNFPKDFTLKNGKTLEIETIGLRTFAILDTLLILNTSNKNGLWSFYSLPEHKYFGSYIKRGEGPLELAQGPSLASKINIIREDENLIAFLYDFQNGGTLKLNISKSIASKNEIITRSHISTPPFLSDFIILDSSTFYIKEIANMDTQQIRSLYKNEKKITHPTLEKLNKAYIEQGEDFNMLAGITKKNNLRNKFVEMPTGLNYINIFSLDENFSKTVCIGEKLMDIKNIQKEEMQNRKYMFSDLRIFDDFFGVVFINENIKDFQTNRTKASSILFFDWDGLPLAKVTLEKHITSFDIDFFNKEIYTFDNQSDELLKYDVSKILSDLKVLSSK